MHKKILELSNVTYYQEKTFILKNISWKVNKDEHWAVIGTNGSGKTMMLKIAAGYLWPSKGSAEILGYHYGEIDLRELRKRIGWVSKAAQQQLLTNLSAFELILSGYYASFGLYDKPDKKILAKAEELFNFMSLPPELKNRPFYLLSSGQQKKVTIARALMHNPNLLILDEPCAALDLASREKFLQTLQKLSEKKAGPTIIYVTHHIEEIMPFITHAILLKNGVVFTQGRKKEVLTEKNLSECLKTPVKFLSRNQRIWLQAPSYK